MFNDPFFKKIGIGIGVLFLLAVIGMATTPKCPGCGKNWNSPTMKYCFGCQAKQAQSSTRYYSENSSFSNSEIKSKCAYDSCPDYAKSGSKYCSKHTCKVDNCNEKVADPVVGYCYTHDKTETRIEPNCHRPKYEGANSDYCNIHYGKH